MINFISNLPRYLRSGGFSGMNAAACAALASREELHYAGPIDPPPFLAQKVLSKLLRLAGLRGDFFFFSQRRLEAIAREAGERCVAGARLDFFHGFTPWILTRPPRPYMAWSDCTFRDYIGIYHQREQFREADLSRIETAEAEWLRKAQRVLFTSEWAASRAVRDYALDPGRVGTVGIFGEIELPAQDGYAGGKQFAFVSTDFNAKGGPVVLAAFSAVRARHTDATLVIAGDHPAAPPPPGVEFTGFLLKEVPAQRERLRSILERSRAVVHPTMRDIAPLLIVEAGYCGCPTISSRMFAIPELVDHGRTGLLLEDATNVAAVADAMNQTLEDEEGYARMRKAAWARAREQHSRQRFEERLRSFVPMT